MVEKGELLPIMVARDGKCDTKRGHSEIVMKVLVLQLAANSNEMLLQC